MKNPEEEIKAYQKAKKRVEDEKGFYIHLVAYVVINIAILFFKHKILLLVNADTKDEEFNFWWLIGNFATPVFWGIGLLFHGLWAFKKTFMFSDKWEKKKIKKIMEEDNL